MGICILENFLKTKNMVKENFIGLICLILTLMKELNIIKESGGMDYQMELENI